MQSSVHSFFFFARPTDPASREGSRAMGNEHFMGMALVVTVYQSAAIPSRNST